MYYYSQKKSHCGLHNPRLARPGPVLRIVEPHLTHRSAPTLLHVCHTSVRHHTRHHRLHRSRLARPNHVLNIVDTQIA